MNKELEQHIAAYMHSGKASDLLLKACRNDRELLSELADFVVTERLLKQASGKVDSEILTQELLYRLEVENTRSSLAQSIEKELHEHESRNLSRKVWQCGASVAASLIVGLMVLLYFVQSPKVGYYKELVGVSSQYNTLFSGYPVYKGDIELNAGYVEIALKNGVGLILEAPIQIEIKSPKRLLLHNGSLVATVPENAIGFKVETPSSEIVDLGTEFGVKVDEQGSSQVHVITGEIKVRGNESKEYVHIKENQALSFLTGKPSQIISSRPNQFVRALPGTSVENPHYLHWSFDELVDGRYKGTGSGIEGRLYDAVPKSLTHDMVAQANGQFGEGVYFDGESSWLETGFPGIGGSKPRTVAFWLKVPKKFSLKHGYGILSWGLQDIKSAWQISPNPEKKDGPLGRIRIGTNTAEVIGSTDIRDNRWHHIAVVLYGGDKVDLSTHVILYVNGEFEQTSKKSIARVFTELAHPESKPLIMGRNIGYHHDEQKISQKFFRGWLDEVFIFDAALDHTQIRHLIKHNRLPSMAE